MKSGKLMFVFFTLFVLFGSMIVIAEEGDTEVKASKRNDFNARLSHINCKVDLIKKQIDLLSMIDNNLTSYKTSLDSDFTKLKEFADAMNHKEFDSYFTTTFKDNLGLAVNAVKTAKGAVIRSNLTKEERSTMKTDHKAIISEYADCVNKRGGEVGEKRADHLNSWIEKWNKVIAKMKEKSYETAEMESVVSDAQNKLIPALQTIRDATTKEARKTAMENARNLHLHLWARFEIARIKSYLGSIEDDAIAKGYQADIDAINARLNDADKLAVSGKRYKGGEFETVWMAIKDAAKMLKDLNKKLKS